nr:replication-associated protein [Tick-associated circular DNA virus]
MAAPRPAFRINAQRLLLTYPQATIDSNLLYGYFQSLPIKPTKAIICTELHQDGNQHTHAAVEFERRVNTTRVHFFDFDGYHPNVQAARSWAACVNYCRKEGTLSVAYFGCSAEDATVATAAEGSSTDDAYAVATASDTIREWFTWCIANNVSYAFANAIWNQLRGAQPPVFYNNDHEGVVSNPFLRGLGWSDSYRTLVICGPSGVGKTSWALAHAPTPFLLVTDIDDLGFFDPVVHKSIVFDEIRCTGDEATGRGAWPLTSQIKLVTWDTPVSIRIRYKVAHLPRHVRKVFTSTTYFPFLGDPQVRRRCDVVNLYEGRATRDLWISYSE